jgi:hypothetical protein
MNRRKFAAFSGFLLAGFLVAFAWQQAEWTAPPVMSHDGEGRDNCLMCHQEAGPKPVPATHAERPNETCLLCHASDAAVQTTAPKMIPHDLEGRDNCLMCHQAAGPKPVPADHEGRVNEYCLFCHSTA